MEEQAPGDAQSKDAMLAFVRSTALPDLRLDASAASFTVGESRTLTVMVRNAVAGEARDVVLTGKLPAGIAPLGIGAPGMCDLRDAGFRCVIPRIPAHAEHRVSVAITAAAEGRYVVETSVSSEMPDADATDNRLAFAASATPATETRSPGPVEPGSGGGGCTSATPHSPLDPTLLVLGGLAAIGLVSRRTGGPQGPVPLDVPHTVSKEEMQ